MLRDKNFGLANNIIDGVTQIVNKYGRVIVLEDDIVTGKYFLRFMNDALEFYKDEERVMHLSGYMYPVMHDALPDYFFIKPTTCWGWATWQRSWRYFEKKPQKIVKEFFKEEIQDFNLDGAYDYWGHVISNLKGKITTWAIFWYTSVYRVGGLSLHPRHSYCANIGFDKTGVHSGASEVYDVVLTKNYNACFPTDISESSAAKRALIDFFNSSRKSFVTRSIGKILSTALRGIR